MAEVWLRFLDGPGERGDDRVLVVLRRGGQAGKAALLLVWDNAWHGSKEVRTWVRDHNRRVKAGGEGVRLVVCPLPIKSPWLNPIEPKWVHTKRKVVEPDRLLPAAELRAGLRRPGLRLP